MGEFLRRVFALIITLVISLSTSPVTANADDFARISGQVSAPDGFALTYARVVVNDGSEAELSADGRFELVLPKNRDLQVTFVTNLRNQNLQALGLMDIFANWKTTINLSQPRILDLRIPQPKKITMSFVDASDKTYSNIIIGEQGFNNVYSPFLQQGQLWSGIQRIAGSPASGRSSTTTGQITFFLFPTSFHPGVYFFGFPRDDLNSRATGLYYSPDFSIIEDVNLKLCLPINFGTALSLPIDCASLDKQNAEREARATTNTASILPPSQSVLTDTGVEIWLDSINQVSMNEKSSLEIGIYQRVKKPELGNGGDLTLVLTDGRTIAGLQRPSPSMPSRTVVYRDFTFSLPPGAVPWFVKWHNRALLGDLKSGPRWKIGDGVPAPKPVAGSPVPKPVTPVKYRNCAALNQVHPGGVARALNWVNRGGKIKQKPTVNAKLYNLNKSLDRDKDGLACER